MKPSIKTLITAALLSLMVFSLQFCKKKDLAIKQDPKIARAIAELSSKPQVVFQKILLTDEEIKQLVASTRSQAAKTMACPGTLYSAVAGYTLTYQGGYSSGCPGADYKVDIMYILWSNEQTDDGPRDHNNPDPALSGVTLTINSNTVYPDMVLYNEADDMVWRCYFGFRYSDVGVSISATSIGTTIFGTFTCANSASGNVNDGHTLTQIDACDSQGIVYPDPTGSAGAGNCYIFFPWDLLCYTGLVPNAGYEIKYRPQGSSGAYSTLSNSTTTFGPVTASGSAGTYEYMSRYGCTGGYGFWWTGTFVIQ